MRHQNYKYIIALLFVTINLTCFAYEPMIREDRIWEYRYGKLIDSDVSASESQSQSIYFKFDGIETVDYQIFSRLVAWTAEEENPVPYKVALMREENKRVYLLLEHETIYTEIPFTMDPTGHSFTPLIIEPANELLLYDFSNERAWADGYGMPICENENFTEIITVTGWDTLDTSDFSQVPDTFFSIVRVYYNDDSVYQDNKKWNVRVLSLSKEKIDEKIMPADIPSLSDDNNTYTEWIVEGVGNIGRGFLHRPYMNRLSDETEIDTKRIHEAYFVRQTDLEGNIIFNAPWVSGSGVEEVEAPEQETDGASYDLSGKRVVNPEPGTIYIQDGKKHIAH